MSRDGPQSSSSTDRRSLLLVGGMTLSPLVSFSTLRTADARVGDDRPTVERTGKVAPSPDDADYEDQRTVTDETGRIEFAVPMTWGDVSTEPNEGNPALAASPDLNEYASSWDVPGIEVILTAEPEGGPAQALEELTDYSGECADGGRRATRLPGHDFVSQGWYHCSSSGATFLSMAGVPSGGMADHHTPGPQSTNVTTGDVESVGAPYMVVVGAQGVTGRDLGAINAAINSLRTNPPNGTRGQDSFHTELVTGITTGETVEGEISADDAAAVYTFDHATAGDRLSVEVSRSGGQGQLAVYLLDPGGATEFPTAIDAAVLEPYGANVITGEPGPTTLAGEAQVSGPGHTVALLPSPFPEGVGPYEFTLDHEAVRTERISSR